MKDQFKPTDPVEVRDFDHQEWVARIFVAKVDCPHPYVVHEEGIGWGISYAQCRHEVVVDPEFAKQTRIAELQQKLEQLEQELAQLKN